MEDNEYVESHVERHIERIGRRTVIQMWAIIAWCAGALFWGGYSYSEFATMRKHLESIDDKMDKITDIDTIRQRQDDNMKRIDKIEQWIMNH